VKIVAIIQARMGSTRLPGKVLKELAGQTVLARVVNRTRRAALLDEVVIATTLKPTDNVIVEECVRLQVPCFRGGEADVLDRYYCAAQEFSPDAIVRITSDCPLIDPQLIDATIRAFQDQKPDYATNSLVITYPRGLDVEVFTVDALARAWSDAKEPYQRVHVTPYIYEHPELFKIVSLTAEKDCSQHRWTLDTEEDLEVIRAIYDHFSEGDRVGWEQVLALMEDHPELAALNSLVRQKALHEG
jgi:spore coat polysaccharide biosynthesis protein SpsF